MHKMKRLLRRFRLWKTPGKYCRHCCVWCRYFEDCENELIIEAEEEK